MVSIIVVASAGHALRLMTGIPARERHRGKQASRPACWCTAGRWTRRGRRRSRDAPEGSTAAHGKNVLRPLTEGGHEVTLRSAFEHVEVPAAVRPVDDAALHAQEREVLLSIDDALDQRSRLFRRLQGQRRMPEQPDVVLGEKARQRVAALAAPFGAQDRHAPTTGTARHPEQRRLRVAGCPAVCVHCEVGRIRPSAIPDVGTYQRRPCGRP